MIVVNFIKDAINFLTNPPIFIRVGGAAVRPPLRTPPRALRGSESRFARVGTGGRE